MTSPEPRTAQGYAAVALQRRSPASDELVDEGRATTWSSVAAVPTSTTTLEFSFAKELNDRPPPYYTSGHGRPRARRTSWKWSSCVRTVCHRSESGRCRRAGRCLLVHRAAELPRCGWAGGLIGYRLIVAAVLRERAGELR